MPVKMIVYLLRQVIHFFLCISTHGNIIKRIGKLLTEERICGGLRSGKRGIP